MSSFEQLHALTLIHVVMAGHERNTVGIHLYTRSVLARPIAQIEISGGTLAVATPCNKVWCLIRQHSSTTVCGKDTRHLPLTPESALHDPRSPGVPLMLLYPTPGVEAGATALCAIRPEGGVSGAADTKLSWSDMQPDSWRRASCSCSCVRCSCRSRAFSCAARAIDRSASSRACFSRDHLSRSRSVLCLAELDSDSRIRCS